MAPPWRIAYGSCRPICCLGLPITKDVVSVCASMAGISTIFCHILTMYRRTHSHWFNFPKKMWWGNVINKIKRNWALNKYGCPFFWALCHCHSARAAFFWSYDHFLHTVKECDIRRPIYGSKQLDWTMKGPKKFNNPIFRIAYHLARVLCCVVLVEWSSLPWGTGANVG